MAQLLVGALMPKIATFFFIKPSLIRPVQHKSTLRVNALKKPPNPPVGSGKPGQHHEVSLMAFEEEKTVVVSTNDPPSTNGEEKKKKKMKNTKAKTDDAEN
ncbi:hypothetical protein Sjap_012961 [Stephania japonica]|uniref:Uncharacterized protein n=1 Tax=Stephania japonica TaxID=461633 RepID=A0AAP0IX49_9MAGN